MALLVTLAPARMNVEQPTGDVRIADVTAGIILKFFEAAFPATIAKGFPLLARHLRELLALPERGLRGQRSIRHFGVLIGAMSSMAH